uniref:Uncharacterized protein n=1 Tax=Meloidogyne javanica TaxID=6303 RepID=A0A915MEV6_MELJA
MYYLNYNYFYSLFPIFGDSTLIVGIGSNHPGGGLATRPGVVQPTAMGTESDKNGNGKNGNGGNGHNNEHMQRITVPSVVGFAANIGKNGYFEFVGDYCYQSLAFEPSSVLFNKY